VTPPPKRRFSRGDWLDLGLEAVGEAGPPGLAIDPLTIRANKTTGSFYAHFASMGAFIEALAGHWRQRFTTDLIDSVSAHPASADRLDHLNRLAFQLDPRVEQGMRRLAAVQPVVARVCERVDGERVAFLALEYARSGRFSAEAARDLARIEYAAFVGVQQTEPGNTPEESMRLYEAFLELTGRN